jgi:NAD(P)H-dependent FMN reductase
MAVKILAFAGSSRKDSFNKKLVRIAAAGAREAGAEVTEIDLRDFPMPIYDGDLEAAEGHPANARKLKDLFVAHHGLLIASPEYNSGISALLKNSIDWVSRPVPGEPSLVAFTGKIAALMATSTGALGGLRGLVQVRMILSNIGVIVLPDQVSIPKAAEAFDDSGAIKDAALNTRVRGLGRKLAEFTGRVRG